MLVSARPAEGLCMTLAILRKQVRELAGLSAPVAKGASGQKTSQKIAIGEVVGS